MSAAEDLLQLHLNVEKIDHWREVWCIPDRNFRFDFKCGKDLLIEVQGGVWLKGKSGHSSGTGITRDCEKLSLAAVYGYRTIVVTPAQIKSGKAIEWIKLALA